MSDADQTESAALATKDPLESGGAMNSGGHAERAAWWLQLPMVAYVVLLIVMIALAVLMAVPVQIDAFLRF